MKAKAEYTPNGYVCNKCGSRMDAIITPPLSTLGKMKLVCNNCNKHMTKTWQERFDEEFNWEVIFGKNSKAQNTVKQFIADLRKHDEEELIKMSEELIQTDRYSGSPRAINNLQQLIKDYYAK